ncbi:MAG TPA: hypothetical protein PLR60_05630 [Syntrophorhabdaceae bacterium]|nr:hypothetical protein [Syntrophorhabdaceae bacterium]
MNREDDFLIKEYFQSIQTGQWFEQSIERHFKNLAIIFIWVITLFGFLLKKNLDSCGFWNAIKNYESKELIIIPGIFFLLCSYATIYNMLNTRREDVLAISRANFIRMYLLSKMPEDFLKKYTCDSRLQHINKFDIYARNGWSLKSDLALYVILSGFMGGILLGVAFGSFLGKYENLHLIFVILVPLIHIFMVTAFSRHWLNNEVPSRNQNNKNKNQPVHNQFLKRISNIYTSPVHLFLILHLSR